MAKLGFGGWIYSICIVEIRLLYKSRIVTDKGNV